MISDNLKTIMALIEASNESEQIDALLVSLDAKKAFDSVDHQYIEKCLIEFGVPNFVPIFRLLYSELNTDIIINGKVTKGFRILRGVKQGDALSCILFIICMEPLLRNIENNPNIEALTHEGLNFPKAVGYADDVNGLLKNSARGLQAIFDEYERLTKLSGLTLNADKTEIMRLRKNGGVNQVNDDALKYLDKRFTLTSKSNIKINGIIFQESPSETKRSNVRAVLDKISIKLSAWSKRGLSILGKILIVKTFGISQIIYLMQMMSLNEDDFKLFNAMLYKFIWNTDFRALKAPDRKKREIMSTNINKGGFGMLDLCDLDEGIKLKSLARLMSAKHPFMSQILLKTDLSDFFHPKVQANSEKFTIRCCEILKKDRLASTSKAVFERNRTYLSLVRNIKIKNTVNSRGKGSLAYFRVIMGNKSLIGDLTLEELRSMQRFIDNRDLYRYMELAILTRDRRQVHVDDLKLYPGKEKLFDMERLTSKEFRTMRDDTDNICIFKSGLILTPYESVNYMYKLRKLNSTSNKNVLLRALHGDVPTNEKLYRFRLTNEPFCDRCNEVDTLTHRLEECEIVKAFIMQLCRRSNALGNTNERSAVSGIKALFAVYNDLDLATLTLHSEAIRMITGKSDLRNPEQIVKRLIDKLFIMEQSTDIKNALALIR
jgi:hypothetical protein